MTTSKTEKFKPVPALLEQEIPFQLNESELKKWFKELPANDSYETCRAVFLLLQNLNALSLPPSRAIKLLECLLEYLAEHATILEKTFLDSTYPLSVQENCNAEILVWVYFELATGFANALEKIDGFGTKRLAALAIYQAFYCLSQALLHINEVYAEPFSGYWQFCYQLYGQAEKLNFLAVKIKKVDGITHTTQHFFNLIIVFELSGTNQFRSRHIKTIYQHLASYIEHIKITDNRKNIDKKHLKSYCIFDLRSDQRPVRITKTLIEDSKNTRCITTVIIAKKMYKDLKQERLKGDATESIQYRILLKAINNLGMAKFRKNRRVKKEKACTGVIGLENLILLLAQDGKHQEQGKEQENTPESPSETPATLESLDARIAGQWEVPDLELVPFGEETAHQMRETYKTKIWHNKKLDQLFSAYQGERTPNTFQIPGTPDTGQDEEQEIYFQGFEIQDSSPQGHKVSCKSDQIRVRTGDVLGIVPDFTGRLELGLVSRLNNSYNDGVSLGIKVLSLETKLAQMSRRGENKEQIDALFLPGTFSIHNADCIVFNSSSYKSGDLVILKLEGKEFRATLGKMLNSTSSILHLEVLSAD